MVEVEHLDIRTVTLGISLFDLAGSDARLPERIFDRVTSLGANLVEIANGVQSDLGVPVVNKRVSVTPIGSIAHGDEEQVIEAARALDAAAKEIGVDYIGGFSALVHKGMTHSERRLLNALPRALAATERMCASVNAASTKAGINMDAVDILGHKILETAELTADQDGIGCAKFVAFANAVEESLTKVLAMPLDRELVLSTVEEVRQVAKEARAVIEETYPTEVLDSFSEALTPIFSRAPRAE